MENSWKRGCVHVTTFDISRRAGANANDFLDHYLIVIGFANLSYYSYGRKSLSSDVLTEKTSNFMSVFVTCGLARNHREDISHKT